MKFNLATAELFVPDGLPAKEALARTTHLCFAAHQDDIEIMAAAPILECFQRTDQWFTGVVVTDGRLELQFSDLGGDLYWVLNGLEIRRLSDGVLPISVSGLGTPTAKSRVSRQMRSPTASNRGRSSATTQWASLGL